MSSVSLNVAVGTLLSHHEFEFQLFGSRYFGTNKVNSDWDFFVEASMPVMNWLCENEFVKANHRKYNDHAICMVWKHETLPIHVVLVHNFHTRLKAIELVKQCPSLIPARNRTRVLATFWNIVFSVVREKGYTIDTLKTRLIEHFGSI